jgi:hypothetical protein
VNIWWLDRVCADLQTTWKDAPKLVAEYAKRIPGRKRVLNLECTVGNEQSACKAVRVRGGMEESRIVVGTSSGDELTRGKDWMEDVGGDECTEEQVSVHCCGVGM